MVYEHIISSYIDNTLFLDWQFSVFIGIHKVNDIWRWQGRLTEPITYGWWGDNNPSGGDRYCIGVGPNVKYKFNDFHCQNEKYFFCERVGNF